MLAQSDLNCNAPGGIRVRAIGPQVQRPALRPARRASNDFGVCLTASHDRSAEM